MSTIRILLGIFCLAAIGCGAEPSGGVIRGCGLCVTGSGPGLLNAQPRNPQHTIRNMLIEIARSQIGVREATGNNDGAQVGAYLKAAKLPKGNPWCAAFISWTFAKAGLDKPRTAWSPALFPLARCTLTPKPADVLGIYSVRLKRIAHAGLVERRQHNWIISIEGNTNAGGGREGDGVYRKWRHIRTIAKFADWIK